ncbi:MAG: NAD(P)-binding oxidoreductase [Ekhidna sp.]
MKLLLLGATGRTGKQVLDDALSSGYHVHCLARKPERIEKREELTVFEGDPSNADDLKKAIHSCDSIISVLNISRTSDFPWSSLRTPREYLSTVMSQLMLVAEANSIKRIVICSAWGVAETKKYLPGWFRWFIDHSNIGVAYSDHERQEKLLEGSKMDWTIVRPVGLTNSKRKQHIRETYGNQPKPSLTINRLSVARYLVGCLKADDLIGQKVIISKA